MASKFFSLFKAAPVKSSPAPDAPTTQPELNETALSAQIEAARALHTQGRLADADAAYRALLETHPESAEAQYRHANVLKDRADLPAALAAYDRAIALKPDYAHAFCNRAVVLGVLGKPADALASYDRAIALDPTDALAHCNRGYVLVSLGQKDAALASFDRAIENQPGHFQAHFGRGGILQEREDWRGALDAYTQAIAIHDADALTHYNRGSVFKALERWDDALGSYQQAIALNPTLVPAHCRRGEVLQHLNRLPEALTTYDRALELNPEDAKTHNNRGVVLQKMLKFDEALMAYDRAIALDAAYAEAHFNRGLALQEMGLLDEAIALYRQSIALNPEFAEAYCNLGFALLKAGDFANGWMLHEWRWRAESGSTFKERREFSEPLWLGRDDITGKTVLLYGEQGLGDALQFCRYVPLVAARGARVILEVPAPLVSVCKTLEGADEVIAFGGVLPPFDYQCPLMSLPLAFATMLDTVPATPGYLRSDPDKTAIWRARLGPTRKPRVGLTWSGQRAGTNLKRHFPLSLLTPFLSDRFHYFCLQTDIAPADLATLDQHAGIFEYGDAVQGFDNTAALCECMDVVVSVDTSIAHLAGALGKKTWVLLAFDADWRWLIDRDDSPWYPTMRLYRQRSRSDWVELFERVAADLAKELT